MLKSILKRPRDSSDESSVGEKKARFNEEEELLLFINEDKDWRITPFDRNEDRPDESPNEKSAFVEDEILPQDKDENVYSKNSIFIPISKYELSENNTKEKIRELSAERVFTITSVVTECEALEKEKVENKILEAAKNGFNVDDLFSNDIE